MWTWNVLLDLPLSIKVRSFALWTYIYTTVFTFTEYIIFGMLYPLPVYPLLPCINQSDSATPWCGISKYGNETGSRDLYTWSATRYFNIPTNNSKSMRPTPYFTHKFRQGSIAQILLQSALPSRSGFGMVEEYTLFAKCMRM